MRAVVVGCVGVKVIGARTQAATVGEQIVVSGVTVPERAVSGKPVAVSTTGVAGTACIWNTATD